MDIEDYNRLGFSLISEIAAHFHEGNAITIIKPCSPDPLPKVTRKAKALHRFHEWSKEVDMRLFGHETAFTNINPLNL